jgi:hypothetical protein
MEKFSMPQISKEKVRAGKKSPAYYLMIPDSLPVKNLYYSSLIICNDLIYRDKK